jgi:hypothetical protein
MTQAAAATTKPHTIQNLSTLSGTSHAVSARAHAVAGISLHSITHPTVVLKASAILVRSTLLKGVVYCVCGDTRGGGSGR